MVTNNEVSVGEAKILTAKGLHLGDEDITPNDVRASELLKERILITYPDDPAKNNDMAVLHIQEDYLLPKHLRHIRSMVLFLILLLLFRSLSVKYIRQKWLHQYCYGAYYMLHE
jgi:hypothetical protein